MWRSNCSPTSAADKSAWARLLSEARLFAPCRTPTWWRPTRWACETEVFLAMELIEGESLTWLSTKQRSWREVLAVLVQAGSGLVAAHKAGLVHRDFKPSNVMVGNDGERP
ncbi:MAG: phosphotransferase [Sphingobacteriales bacterium]|nr:phosphotransferase [Sphingobacteriales bacterium]